jgi:hypothetical protein
VQSAGRHTPTGSYTFTNVPDMSTRIARKRFGHLRHLWLSHARAPDDRAGVNRDSEFVENLLGRTLKRASINHSGDEARLAFQKYFLRR